MMSPVAGDSLDPAVEIRYRDALFNDSAGGQSGYDILRIDRFAFYQQAEKAFSVVMTGEAAKYENIILKKGLTPV